MYKSLKFSFLFLVIVTAFVGQAQPGAQLSNWQQMNGQFTAMCTVPNQPSTIFIGDNSGLIRKSTDKGTTWKRVYRTGLPITDIHFLNEQTGFAVSNFSSGLIFSTNDGGESWTRKQIYDATEPTNTMRFSAFKKIIAIDHQSAIFELLGGGSASGLKENITTRDGGKTFNIETSPDNLFHVAGDTLIAFGYELDMFNLKKMKISKSFDKGKTWVKAPSIPVGANSTLHVYGVDYAYFFNTKKFYFTCAKPNDYTLYQSIDGGTTITAANMPAGKNTRVLWIDYKNSQHGIMLTNASVSPFQQTTDGGATWIGISGINPMLPIIKIDGDELLASNTNRCMRTNSYGASWNNLSDNIYQVAITNTAPSSAFLNTVTHNTFYASLSAIWGGTYYGKTLVRSNDEGLSWHNVTDNANVVYGGESFHFTAPDTMLFVQNYALYKSIDGGKTSKITAKDIYFNGSGNAVPKFSFIKGSKTYGVAYAILGSSEFWLTKDGGDSWSKTTGTTPYLSVRKIQIIAPDIWYMLASENNKAAVYKSTDEGKSWNNITGTIFLNANAEVIDAAGMSFANKNTGYVFGGQGEIYQTTDGGSNWTSIRNELPQSVRYYNFVNMAFRTENEGYLHPGVNVTNQKVWQTGTTGLKMEFSNDTTLGAMMDNYGNFYKYFASTKLTTENILISKVTGLDRTKGESARIRIFPNPAHDQLHIETDGLLRIAIIDLMGKTHREEVIHGHSVISIKDLQNGIYMIRTIHQDQAQTQTMKFVKQ